MLNSDSKIEQPVTVLVVGGDAGFNHLIRRTLESEGFNTQQASNGSEAINSLVSSPIQVLLSDYLLPDMTGLQLIGALKQENLDIPAIIMTGRQDERIAFDMMKQGVKDCLIKEANFVEELPKVIKRIFKELNNEKELARAQKALRESEARYRILFESSADGILIADVKSKKFKYANPAICAMLLYCEKELLEMGVTDIHPKKDPEGAISMFEAQAAGERRFAESVPCLRKDGSILYADINATKIILDGKEHIVGFFRDITDRRRAEEEKEKLQNQLHQSQKMDALGQLAGGVAHDFNNILGAIIGFCDVLQVKMEQAPDLLKYVEKIKSASLYAAHIIKQLLTFARKVNFEIKPVDIHNEIKQTIEMLKHAIDKRIEIQSRLNADSFIIEGDQNLIQNMLLNIGINARDAMPEGGILTFTTETVSLDTKSLLNKDIIVTPGNYLKISIADTGIGMDSEIIQYIFEPFFTTKDAGKGTGLGLSAVYGTVNKHNGYIAVDSKTGEGSAFTIYLPLTIKSYMIIENRRTEAPKIDTGWSLMTKKTSE